MKQPEIFWACLHCDTVNTVQGREDQLNFGRNTPKTQSENADEGVKRKLMEEQVTGPSTAAKRQKREKRLVPSNRNTPIISKGTAC